MVSLATDSLSGVISKKRPSEDVFIPKYKPRKVIAYRDFPVGCGTNTAPKKHENVGIGTDGTESATVFRSSETMPVGTDDVEKSVMSNTSEPAALSTEKTVVTEVVEARHEPVTLGLIDPVSLIETNETSELKVDMSSSDVIQVFPQDEVECNRHEMVDNPAVDGAQSSGALLEEAKAIAMDHPVESTAETNLVGLKDKFRHRKVCAIRHFPPCCGGNALLPTNVKAKDLPVEKNEVDSVGSVDSSRNVNRKNSVEKKSAKSECKSMAVPKGSPGRNTENILGPKDKGGVRFSARKEVASSGKFGPREVVHGLMAEPWTKGKLSLKILNDGTRAVQRKSRSPSKAVVKADTTSSCSYSPLSKELSPSLPEKGDDDDDDRGAYNGVSLDIMPSSVCQSESENNDDYCSRTVPYDSIRNRPAAGESEEMRTDQIDQKKLSRFNSKPVSKKNVAAKSKNLRRAFTAKKTASSRALILSGNRSISGSRKPKCFEVGLPPFNANASGNGDARDRVRETLRLFHAIVRKLVHAEEAKIPPENSAVRGGRKMKRVDLEAAGVIKRMGKEVNTDEQILGLVPGVEVGDEFQYRVELALVGIHRLYQAGIDSVKRNGMLVASSVVSSGAYADDMENADVLIYSGHGGNVLKKSREPEDQKLEKGNLALRNSISMQNPVRVIRGWKSMKAVDPLDPKPKQVTTYIYDGIYTVKRYWAETGPHGKRVFMFELRRDPDQPELAWKQLMKSSKSTAWPGVCIEDVALSREPFPISAVNTLDDEMVPAFEYVPKMKYPDWFRQRPPAGCDCTGLCSDSKKCSCAVRNGGEIPYNHNGALVETKPLVFECGPGCRCLPSCYNRVSQRGIRFRFEVFKTESRGWGLRALTSIPSGSFICEYAGELLEEREAEKRVGSDEYLFDIGHHGHEEGFTIDAAEYGNLGRFINHSCMPNLYAQDVVYDHDDTRMPHIMFFALENITPLKELTYDYNYSMGQIRDTDGNVKVKECFCGAASCTGRLY
ncbi:hypothetical protein M569_13026 [Genlisea aurea]|uniref:Uncharacterized protein n=1 Tax=Genlisea aurea TaxID=192259 RepID=S8DPP2_9LAMI|nr:hypothetical protein M569_13026 [Genlisea aurea]